MIKKSMNCAAMLAVVLMTAGCASQYGITYDSFPRGATLLCGGRVMGYTPTTLYIKKSLIKNETRLDLTGCTANWASGASNNYRTISLQEFPNGVTITAPRPDEPGLQKDMEFALVAQQVQNLQQQQYQQQVQSMTDSQPKSTNCTKVGDLSGRIYQFKYGCPYGYLQSYQ